MSLQGSVGQDGEPPELVESRRGLVGMKSNASCVLSHQDVQLGKGPCGKASPREMARLRQSGGLRVLPFHSGARLVGKKTRLVVSPEAGLLPGRLRFPTGRTPDILGGPTPRC